MMRAFSFPLHIAAIELFTLLPAWYPKDMQKRRAPSSTAAFTIVELIVVITVIAILAAVAVVAYKGIQESAATKAVQSDLAQSTAFMQRYALKNGNTYPAMLPSDVATSPGVTMTLKKSGTYNFYTPLNTTQNGELMAQICQDLIDEGAGKGTNQNGVVKDYVIGCGNWNRGDMQITAWETQKFTAPVTSAALLNYADNYTTNDSFNKNAEVVTRSFYHELVDRQLKQGGSYPITSFWDSWATPTNGGTQYQALPSPQPRPTYCIEAVHTKYSDAIYHVTEENKILSGGC